MSHKMRATKLNSEIFAFDRIIYRYISIKKYYKINFIINIIYILKYISSKSKIKYINVYLIRYYPFKLNET